MILPERTEDNFIITYTGKKFWPLNPREEDVDIEDIAHALANITRWTGHCSDIFTVADHSIIMADVIKNPKYKLHTLLHDASEAYLSDIARPIKSFIPNYKEFEDNLMTAIFNALDVPYVEGLLPQEVHDLDRLMMYNEAYILMPKTFPLPPKEEWKNGEILDEIRICFDMPMDEVDFLDLFYHLKDELKKVA